MGHKAHPIGLRLGLHRKWKSNWFFDSKNYAKFIHLNFNIEKFFKGFLFAHTIKTLLLNCQLIKLATNQIFIFVFFYRLRKKFKRKIFKSKFKQFKLEKWQLKLKKHFFKIKFKNLSINYYLKQYNFFFINKFKYILIKYNTSIKPLILKNVIRHNNLNLFIQLKIKFLNYYKELTLIVNKITRLFQLKILNKKFFKIILNKILLKIKYLKLNINIFKYFKLFNQNKKKYSLFSKDNFNLINFYNNLFYKNLLFISKNNFFKNKFIIKKVLKHYILQIKKFLKNKFLLKKILKNKFSLKKIFKKSYNLNKNFSGKQQITKFSKNLKKNLICTKYKHYISFKHIKKFLSNYTNSKINLVFINALSFTKFFYMFTINKKTKKPQKYNVLEVQKNMINRFKYDAIFIKDFIHLTFISMLLKNINCLVAFIGQQFKRLPKNRKQFKLLKFIQQSLKIFSQQRKEFLGFKFQIKGRLNRRNRTNRWVFKKGILPIQTHATRVEYGYSEGWTRRGLIGIKLWIFYKKNFKQVLEKRFLEYLYYTKYKHFLNKKNTLSIKFWPKKLKNNSNLKSSTKIGPKKLKNNSNLKNSTKIWNKIKHVKTKSKKI